MRRSLHSFHLLFLLIISVQMSAQTMVVGKPVSDERGMVAFQITQIINIEGEWEPPLVLGELLYPQKPQKAHPIMRFGEAVLIALTDSGNRRAWQGLHVHNGCIPALQGKPLAEKIKEVEKEAKEREAHLAASPNPKDNKGRPTKKSPPEQFGICPICQQRHIRIH